jgi:hypothetical protein
MKEGVIPRVLVKESLNLELQLQRYGEKKFRDLFIISRKWLGVFLEIFLEIRGASCKYVGCGLILEKMRGLSAKWQEMGFSRNYFVEEKPVDQVHGSVDRASPVHHGPAAIVARESSPELGGGGRGKHRGPDSGLTGARKVVERWRDDGEGDGGGALGVGSLRVRREGKEG